MFGEECLLGRKLTLSQCRILAFINQLLRAKSNTRLFFNRLSQFSDISVIKSLNERNHQCLNRAKQINQQMSIRVRDLDTSVLTVGDNIVYCQ